MRPSVPTSHPALGLAKATAQQPLTPGNLNHVLPASLVAKTLAMSEPPVQIQAFLPPCVVTQVPLDAKENSPGNAGGILLLISCQVIPSVVRRSGNTPFTESLCAMPRIGVQNAKPS